MGPIVACGAVSGLLEGGVVKTRGSAFAEKLVAERRRAERERLENVLVFQLQARKIRGWKREVSFVPGRRFRWDFAFCEEKLAIEIQGGTWSGGRHTRGGGYEQDCIKAQLAALAGWAVLPFTGSQVVRGEAVDVIERALRQRRKEKSA